MRIVLILLMCWGVAFGQDTTKYFKSVDYGWNWQRGKFRGGLILPTDTVNNKLGIAQIGATCFAWSGLKWNPIGNTDTAFLVRYYRKNQVDSLISANSVAYTLQDITTNGKTTTDTIIAASFKRTGGSSSQFLKANGSIDNSTYLTSSSLTGYVPYSSYGSNNISANNYFNGFTMIDASTTPIVLTVNSTPSYLITGRDGQTIKLPNATTLPNGAIFTFNNNQSSGSILVNNNSNTLIKSIASGANVIIELIDNTNAAGSWDVHSQSPSNVSWSTNTFDYVGSITGATWNGSNVAINRGGTGANTAAAARTNLGSTIVGDNLFTLTNPSAIRFPRINANNTISLLDSALFASAIGAGTVTSVATGYGLTGGTITTTGTARVDSTVILPLSSITLNTSGSIHNTPITFTRLGGAWSATMSLANQSANTIFRRSTGTGIPSFGTIDSAYFGGVFAPQVRAAQNNFFTLPSLKNGSALFFNGTTIGQDTLNYFWDNTNKRLGVGTITPSYSFDVVGGIRATTTSTSNGFFLNSTISSVNHTLQITPRSALVGGSLAYDFALGDNNRVYFGSYQSLFTGTGGVQISRDLTYSTNSWALTATTASLGSTTYINTNNSLNGQLVFGSVGNAYKQGIFANALTTYARADIGICLNNALDGTNATYANNSKLRIYSATGNVTIGDNIADVTSAKLQVSSTTQGFLPPRMTATQRTAIASPAVGLMVYQTDGTEGIYVYASSGWKMLTML